MLMTSSTQNNTAIITHRGLDPSIPDYYTESSYEAFLDQLNRGYGLEFDVNFSKDGKFFVFHDAGLERITGGADKRLFKNLSLEEILDLRIRNNRLCSLEELLDLIADKAQGISALHLKGKFQEKSCLVTLLDCIGDNKKAADKMMIFDVKIETARFLKNKMPELKLAPSVAHSYDIKRYNEFVGKTLYSIEETLKNKDLFDWAWMDEWDLANENGGTKTLYSRENFDILKATGIKVALVTPELHGTSPGLLGGEAHPDAASHESLFRRIKEIIELSPDAICTDYPDKSKELI